MEGAGACNVSSARVLFQRNWKDAVAVEDRGASSSYCQLMLALENARNHLSVAVASESKRTPPREWRQYIETEHRVLRCLRRLRAGPMGGKAAQARWLRALLELRAHAFDENSSQSVAHRMCEQLNRALAELELE